MPNGCISFCFAYGHHSTAYGVFLCHSNQAAMSSRKRALDKDDLKDAVERNSEFRKLMSPSITNLMEQLKATTDRLKKLEATVEDIVPKMSKMQSQIDELRQIATTPTVAPRVNNNNIERDNTVLEKLNRKHDYKASNN
jgi:hypothetical protein